MRADTPSLTARVVAAWRGLGRRLPPAARLADDPYGVLFADRAHRHLAEGPAALLVPLWPPVLYMQVRTKALDDALRAFVAAGGRQVLILGAGYDARAARFATELAGARVFEVDHPATQARKCGVLARAGVAPDVTYVPWDFEVRPVGELPTALRALGHDPASPTLTLWEGVTMYLSEPAIEATVAAVGALSAPGSTFVLTYQDRRKIDRPGPIWRAVARVVARVGEPFTFGWRPDEVGGWFAPRGWRLVTDDDGVDLARRWLPRRYARLVVPRGHHVATFERRTP